MKNGIYYNQAMNTLILFKFCKPSSKNYAEIWFNGVRRVLTRYEYALLGEKPSFVKYIGEL